MNLLHQELREQSKQQQESLIALRRRLHQFPEVGWQEKHTSQRLRTEVESRGLTPSYPLADHGFYVDIKGDQPGPIVAWRADMDALPIVDQKDAPYKSQHEGFGHMCGHDVHSTVALGIANILKAHQNKIKGTVRIFWQPAEECNPSGAPVMIEDGVLKDVEAVYGMHCDPDLKTGFFSMREREETAAFDAFDITVSSEHTVHSARPHLGKDTIWIAHQVMHQLYQISGRLTDANFPTVIAICKFHGGNAINVIPDSVTFSGTARAARDVERTFIRERILQIAESATKLYGAEVRAEFGKGAPSVLNDERLFANFRQVAIKEFGEKSFVNRLQSMGAEDFAYYTHEVPGLFIRVGTAESEKTSHALHSSYFDIDESILSDTCAFMAYVLLNHLETQPLAKK